MLINPGNEIKIFFWALICGQIICLIFDIFRALRKNTSSSVYSVNLHDLLFCFAAFFIVYKTFNKINNGSVRWFEIAAVLISVVVYFLYESAYILKFMSLILLWLLKPFRVLFTVISKVKNMTDKYIFSPLSGYLVGFSRKYIKKHRKSR